MNNKMLSESKFYSGYSRWLDDESKYETWSDSVTRVINMHKKKYNAIMTDELLSYINFANDQYLNQLVLGSQRSLQFGGEQIFKHEARLYNCTVSYVDRIEFFKQAFYLLLCGCGVGFSVQKQHIEKLPKIKHRSEKKAKIFTVPDSIEGWADAFGVLISSYCEDGGDFPEYKGYQVHFDYSKIRPKGAMISGGFKAPGPDGLRNALEKCTTLLDKETEGKCLVPLRSIVVYDLVMHISDAVLSGGVRRSATICVFSKDDKEMLNAKTGNWFIDNPQRARSNNSVILLRDEITREEWADIMKSVKDFGEPGFIFTDSLEFLFNPCLTGDTLVELENNEFITIKELSKLLENGDTQINVKSYNVNEDTVEYKPAYLGIKTKQNTNVIKITLENGNTLKLTPDHLVYTSNRGYIKACELTNTDDLVLSNFDESKYIETTETTVNPYIDDKWCNRVFSM